MYPSVSHTTAPKLATCVAARAVACTLPLATCKLPCSVYARPGSGPAYWTEPASAEHALLDGSDIGGSCGLVHDPQKAGGHCCQKLAPAAVQGSATFRTSLQVSRKCAAASRSSVCLCLPPVDPLPEARRPSCCWTRSGSFFGLCMAGRRAETADALAPGAGSLPAIAASSMLRLQRLFVSLPGSVCVRCYSCVREMPQLKTTGTPCTRGLVSCSRCLR